MKVGKPFLKEFYGLVAQTRPVEDDGGI